MPNVPNVYIRPIYDATGNIIGYELVTIAPPSDRPPVPTGAE